MPIVTIRYTNITTFWHKLRFSLYLNVPPCHTGHFGETSFLIYCLVPFLNNLLLCFEVRRGLPGNYGLVLKLSRNPKELHYLWQKNVTNLLFYSVPILLTNSGIRSSRNLRIPSPRTAGN